MYNIQYGAVPIIRGLRDLRLSRSGSDESTDPATAQTKGDFTYVPNKSIFFPFALPTIKPSVTVRATSASPFSKASIILPNQEINMQVNRFDADKHII